MKDVCRRYINDEQTVEDVLHDAFVIIFTSFDRLRDARRAEPWMMAITRNVASKYKEHLEAFRAVPLEETKEAEWMASEDSERNVRGVPLNEVVKMIDSLPVGYGQVFRLSVFEGMTHKEIADMLGIEPHSSSSQLARAKKMLRKMMLQYWAYGLLLLLVPITIFMIRKGDNAVMDEKPAWAEQKDMSKDIPTEQPQETSTVHPLVHTIHAIDTLKQTIAQATDSVIYDSLSIIKAPKHMTHEAMATSTTGTTHKVEVPHYNITNLRRNKSKNSNDWHLALAYTRSPQSDTRRTDNYMTMPPLSGIMTRSGKLYNWGDYMDYVTANEGVMDSVSASNMRHVALINSNHPLEPLTETKHHERPLTLQLSLSRPLWQNWSLATGLSYTRMKSTFESGNANTLIHRTQRIHQLGIPLKLSFSMGSGNRWNLYATGGIQLDIPISARLTTQYTYGGIYAPIGNSPVIDASIQAPWQWSVGVGVGVQYQIAPHLNLYLEPSMNYFIPTSSSIETYRTENPFDLSLPFGIRFTW